MEDVLREVIKSVKPVQEEELRVRKFVNELLRISKTVSGLDSVICGSLGKYTWISGDHDIDLFISFDKSVSREDLEKNGLSFGKKIAAEMKGKHEIKYAEHPYVHAMINFEGQIYDVDIVPCYKIFPGEHIKSAVDRSPLHLEYILSHLDPELRDDVRLLKQFCKGTGVYGSDAKNMGFSGYICELLVLKYKSFENTLRAACRWSPGQLIEFSIEKTQILGKFRDQPLIIIDPTDKERNAAAVVSPDNFLSFVSLSRRFLEKPSVDYFFPKKKPSMAKSEISALKKRGTKFIALLMKKTELIDDIFYPQVRRAVKRLESLLNHNDFRTVRSFEIVSDDAVLFVFELETWAMPEIKKMLGPPVFSKIHSDEFISKYKHPYLEGIYWAADRKRDYITAIDLLKSFIRKPLEKMPDEGIPKNIAKEFSSSRILEDEQFWKFIEKNQEISGKIKEKYFRDWL